ncbi:hypothetical protein D3C83_230350 [compost metagenome]
MCCMIPSSASACLRLRRLPGACDGVGNVRAGNTWMLTRGKACLGKFPLTAA